MDRFVHRLNVVLSILLLVLLFASGLALNFLPNGWFFIFAVLASAFILFVLFSRFVIRHFTRPLTETEMAIRQLCEGNFNIRTYVYGPESLGRLNHLLNHLADRLQQMKQSSETQQDQLKTLIENIGSSFLFIDSSGRIQIANHIFQQTFQMKKNEWFQQKYDDVFPYDELVHLIEQAIVEETAIRKTLVIPIGIVRHHFHVYCAPIQHGYHRSEGTVVVFHDITELKKLEQVRKDFVANVSHELKTPVTSLKGFAETLLEEDAASDETIRKKFLTIIRKESERLEALISDLLELSKIENEKFQLNWQQVNLTELVKDTLTVLRERADQKRITLQLTADDHTQIEGDPYRLKQIVMNVIDNAMTYSPKGSTVSISLEEREERVAFVITDSGIGIDSEEIPRIFERFYRVDKGRSRDSGGTGLGLAIVKHLTEAHKGHIEVSSQKGKGTTFKIIFNKQREDKRRIDQ